MDMLNEGATAPANDDVRDEAGGDELFDLGADFEAALDAMEADEGDAPEPADGDADVTADAPAPDPVEDAPSEPAPADEEGKAAPEGNPSPETDAAKGEEPVAAPETWSEEEKATFAKLPADAQRVVSERYRSMEADYTRKSQENADKVKLADGVQALVTDDLRGALEREGMDVVGGIKSLLDLQSFAQRDPAGYARMVVQHAQANGVDVRSILGGASTGEGKAEADPFADPETAALKAKVGELEGRYTADQRAQAAARVQAQVNEFADAKGDDGSPLRPHFTAVEGTMAQLMRADRSLDLAGAYDKAVWLVPEARDAILADRARAEAASAATEQAREAEEAKRAAAVNVSGRSAPTAPASGGSFEDDLDQAAAELGIRF